MFTQLRPSSYQQLPALLHQRIKAEPVEHPYFVWFNRSLATELTLNHEAEQDPEILAVLAGNALPAGIDSIALAYAGHQFGVYVPQLGDGRAVMLGEVVDYENKHWDIQLKGSGQTRFSRQGDGRAPLAATIREAIISEAMHGLGISTTRTLAVVGCAQKIYREQGPVPAGVLTRVAASHLRVGSFQYAASTDTLEPLKALADYAINRLFPNLPEEEVPYLAFFTEILERQAQLIAQWMGVGFIHGVMNTDNMSISGETLDYGPCAFMDEFSWNQVFSSIDLQGRYAYVNQANIAYWNCAQLARTLEPLLQTKDQRHIQSLYDRLQTFPQKFETYWLHTLGAKLGLIQPESEDLAFMNEFLVILQEAKADFTNSFRLLCNAVDKKSAQNKLLQKLNDTSKAQFWVQKWLKKIQQQSVPLHTLKERMQMVNPAYIPRNHLVEQAINNVVENNDKALMEILLKALSQPYTEQPEYEHLQQLPKESERVYQTFCGT